MKINPSAWGVAFATCLPLLATAQAANTEPPRAKPQLTYRSAFTDYKPYRDGRLASWRELNAAVADGESGQGMGGMKGMQGMDGMKGMGGMAGMEMPATPAGPASAPMQMKAMPKPMPMHDGHRMNGGKP